MGWNTLRKDLAEEFLTWIGSLCSLEPLLKIVLLLTLTIPQLFLIPTLIGKPKLDHSYLNGCGPHIMGVLNKFKKGRDVVTKMKNLIILRRIYIDSSQSSRDGTRMSLEIESIKFLCVR